MSVSSAGSTGLTGSNWLLKAIGQPNLHSASTHDFIPATTQLPATIPDFTGREEQLALLDSLLRRAEDTHGTVGRVNPLNSTSVAIIDGPGGVGKTTLLMHWAHRVQERFPDGTLYLNLRGYGPHKPLSPTVALASFLPALGVRQVDIPHEVDAQIRLYRSTLAGRRVLIVLDNALNADQVRPLLPGVSSCLVTVTSRASLTELVIREAAERISLGSFDIAESHTLLRQILGPERLDAEQAAITNLVHKCSGLPLALRLAATRVAMYPQLNVADVVADIDDRLSKDDSEENADRGSGNLTAAIRTVFDWSYTRLSPESARVFRLLGLHPGPEFGVLAASALAGLDRIATYRCLEVLAESHLVEPIGPNRYRMHDLLHDYAGHLANRSDTVDDRRRALERVITWYGRAAREADRLVFPKFASLDVKLHPVGEKVGLADQAEAQKWLFAEQPNLMAALQAAVKHEIYPPAFMLASTARFIIHGPRPMWTLRLEAETLGIIAAQASGDTEAELFLRSFRGDTLDTLERLEEAEADFTSALISDSVGKLLALIGLGTVHRKRQLYQHARQCYLQARQRAQQTNVPLFEAVAECNLAAIAVELGEYDQALRNTEREYQLRRLVGDEIGAAYALYGAAKARHGKGEHAAAVDLVNQALAVYRPLASFKACMTKMLRLAAASQEKLGNLTKAAEYLAEAVALMSNLEYPETEAVQQQLHALTKRTTP